MQSTSSDFDATHRSKMPLTGVRVSDGGKGLTARGTNMKPKQQNDYNSPMQTHNKEVRIEKQGFPMTPLSSLLIVSTKKGKSGLKYVRASFY